jgi:hypothetical protein
VPSRVRDECVNMVLCPRGDVVNLSPRVIATEAQLNRRRLTEPWMTLSANDHLTPSMERLPFHASITSRFDSPGTRLKRSRTLPTSTTDTVRESSRDRDFHAHHGLQLAAKRRARPVRAFFR